MTKKEFLEAVQKNAITKQLKKTVEKYGYELGGEPYITEYGYVSCGILPKDRGFRCFTPDFYLDVSFSKTDENLKSYYKYTWKMQTPAFWSIEGEELDKYVEGVNRGYALYKELLKIDLYKAEQRPAKLED